MKRKIGMAEILTDKRAAETFKELVKAGVAASTLEHWLLALAHCDDTGIAQRYAGHKTEQQLFRQRARALAEKIRMLPTDAHGILYYRGCPVTATSEEIEEIVARLAVLPRLADLFERVGSRRRRSRGRSKRNQNILYLLLAIKAGTGEDHYAEAVQLLDAVDAACGRDASCSEGQLSGIVGRYTEGIAKLMGSN